MPRFCALLLLGVAFLPGFAPAQETSKPEIPVVASAETEKLAALEGATVRVTGFVERAAKSSAGNQFLNFSGSEFTTVTFSSDVPKFGERAPADTYGRKTVAVTGPIKIYKGKPEIVLNHPSQIEIIDPSQAAVPEAKPESPPEPEPEPAPEPEAPAPEAAPEEKPPPDPSKPGPVDWRKYFPE